MSVADQAATHPVERTQRFGTIVIVGGGCYGSYYVRQLLRARDAAAASWERLVVVDRDPRCAVASTSQDDVQIIIADWRAFFSNYLGRAASDRDAVVADAIVPTPLMPHLMFDWLLERARARWPDRNVRQEPLQVAPPIPWQRAAPDGTHYVSFAEWMCPINCIEPRRCPHTRGERTWSLPVAARAYVRAAHDRGEPLAGPVIFHCVHRTYGVGMFDTREVLDGDAVVRAAAESHEAAILIGTMSHCHGAFARLVVGPPQGSVGQTL